MQTEEQVTVMRRLKQYAINDLGYAVANLEEHISLDRFAIFRFILFKSREQPQPMDAYLLWDGNKPSTLEIKPLDLDKKEA